MNEVAESWFTDEYFIHELFNGCNPCTIKIVQDPCVLRPEFHELRDDNGHPIDLHKIPKGDLFINTYYELRNFCHPNQLLAEIRKIYIMEPEILICKA